MTLKRVAILISGRGSNMAALIEAAKAADYPAEMVLILSNVPEASGLTRAREAGIATEIIDHKPFGSTGYFFKRATGQSGECRHWWRDLKYDRLLGRRHLDDERV